MAAADFVNFGRDEVVEAADVMWRRVGACIVFNDDFSICYLSVTQCILKILLLSFQREKLVVEWNAY